MDPDRSRRVRELFDRALKLAAEERGAFLREACADEEERVEVTRLLDSVLADSTVVAPTVDRAADSPSLPGSASRTSGRTIGPYRIVRKLGEGGMGEVYEARQEQPVVRTVALKVVRRDLDSEQVLARFEAERQALAMMTHPTIARVHDAGADEHGRPYFAMEYIRGIPLTDYCDRHNLDTRERLELMIQVCEGVQHAHQKGIIHRDLKPANVLVEVQDGRAVPRIIDFGVAKATDRRLTERSLFTEFGQIIGTPEYMSPEQAEMSNLDVDSRTDVYSLGVMLYELLTGVLPFDPRELRRAGYDEIRRHIREETPAKPSTRLSTMGEAGREVASHRSVDTATLVRLCRQDLDWVTMKALEKDRTHRYAGASELAADLRRHLNDEPVVAGAPSVGYRLRKFVRRHRAGVIAASLLMLSVLVGLTGTSLALMRALDAERRATLEAQTADEVTDFMIGMFEISDPGESRGASITAREILDRARDRVRGELADQPGLQSRLLDAMGRVYRSLGLYTDARPLLEQAIAGAEASHGPDHPEVASALNALGGLLLLRGEADEAERVCRRAMEIQERTLPTDAIDRARTLNNLGNVERLRQRYAESLPYFEQARAIRERALGTDHPDVARMLNQIGWVQMRLESFDEARATFRRAVATLDRAHGPDHPDAIRVLLNQAQLERRVGNFDGARGMLDRILAIQSRILPEDHPTFVNTHYERALTERDAGELDSALRAADRASALAEGPPRHRLWSAVNRVRESVASAVAERDGPGS